VKEGYKNLIIRLSLPEKIKHMANVWHSDGIQKVNIFVGSYPKKVVNRRKYDQTRISRVYLDVNYEGKHLNRPNISFWNVIIPNRFSSWYIWN
jgi:hypothetical protein